MQLSTTFLTFAAILLLTGCSGLSTGRSSNVQTQPTVNSGTLSVTPTSLSFGNVNVGNSSSLTGTLSASSADVTVSTADYQGTGYTLSGITFPVTVAAGQSATFTVTFTPQVAGSSPGRIAFFSNASNSSLTQTFSGNGLQTTQHSVALSWNASTSSVVGYNVYRGTQTGGPYSAKLTSAPVASTNYTDSSVASGTTYFYVTTAVDSSNTESAYSNEATAVVP